MPDTSLEGSPDDNAREKARDRARRLFEFLKRFNERRSPPARDLDSAAWKIAFADLPVQPSVQPGTGIEADNGVVLTITLPALTSCPTPPSALSDWLLPGWKEPHKSPQVKTTRPRALPSSMDGVTLREDDVVTRFEEDPTRAAAFAQWQKVRTRWADAELPIREAADLYQEVLGLWARLQREGDELRLYLGDGFLIWQQEGDGGGPVQHPLILQEVELRLDEKRQQLSFVETSKAPFLYAQLLSMLPELMGKARQLCRTIVENSGKNGGCHPLATSTTDGVIKQLAGVLDVKEILEAGESLAKATSIRTIQRRPVIFAVPPVSGLEAACESFLEWLAEGGDLPLALSRIVAHEVERAEEGDGTARTALPAAADLFFTLPSNAAQEQIALRLEQSGTVLVQGPPGTGKTHTIANLIGHLLAQGKRVLITAQTTKALRVLREKVTPALQPLCVSVLDSDLESRAELVHSVNGIVSKLTSSPESFGPLAERLGEQRRQLNATIAEQEQALRTALRSEYEDIVVGGEGIPPSQAARMLAENSDRDGWIPGPLARGEPIPLGEAEVGELYGLGAEVSADDEALVLKGLPDPASLLATEQFASLIEDLAAVTPGPGGRSIWSPSAPRPTAEQILRVLDMLDEVLSSLSSNEEWQLACLQAGLLGGPHLETWEGLTTLIDEAAAELPLLKPLALEHEVRLGPITDAGEAQRSCEELAAHVERGGGLSWLSLIGKSSWSEILESTTVSGREPAKAEHFRAVRAAVRVDSLRDRLRRRWQSVMTVAGHPLPDEHRGEPEAYADVVVVEMKRLLAWWKSRMEPCVAALVGIGVQFQFVLEHTSVKPPNAEANRLLSAARDTIIPALKNELARLRRAQLETQLQDGLATLPAFPWLPPARDALSALRARDVSGYFTSIEELWRLWSLTPKVKRRAALLSQLAPASLAWFYAIRRREPGHQGPRSPGSARDAWLYRQCEEELSRRQRLDAHEAQRLLAQLRDQLRDINGRLVENLAWASQVERTAPAQHRALMAWLDLVRRIGKGTGKRTDELKREAQRQLEAARDSVPVWIMPLTRVTESFVPGRNRFDVVILDEASQCDLRTIVALTLGDNVVIVGDDEQVSPIDVGESLGELIALQSEYLFDFKDRDLFDGRASAYEQGRRSFPGGLIRLVEHFRCVPDIIGFSNSLSYKGEILPLREASSAKIAPAVVPHRVIGGQRDSHSQTNRLEALEIASLVAACCESPAYAGLTIGVVSLLADGQSKIIDSLLQRMLDTGEYKRRRLVCGSPPDFQGDERDVMFLSMVYSPDVGPLTMIQLDDQKRRYNVAASRARDQMWVVHSLDPEKDLKPGDLRRRLLDHAANPKNTRVADQRERTESDFERKVFEFLIEKGFRVISQVEVGAYRLDLVVEGAKGRVALECDGDRFHPPEKLDQDLERQTILERLGWRFLRTRGSAFYRNPAKEMQRIVERLNDLGIEPIGEAQVEAQASDDVLAKVVARAAVLRRVWLADAGESIDELFEKSAPVRRRGRPGRGSAPSSEESSNLTRATRSNPVASAIPHVAASALAAQTASVAAAVAKAKVPAPPARVPSSNAGAASAVLVSNVLRLGTFSVGKSKELVRKAIENAFDPVTNGCPLCRSRRRVWVGKDGPFLQCDSKTCAKREDVSAPIITAALHQIGAVCDCGAPMKLARLGGATFIGCSNYPSHRKSIAWKDL